VTDCADETRMPFECYHEVNFSLNLWGWAFGLYFDGSRTADARRGGIPELRMAGRTVIGSLFKKGPITAVLGIRRYGIPPLWASAVGVIRS